jgi:hypothetical protein
MTNCRYDFKKGWWCSRDFRHSGPCALRPRWWNWAEDARRYRRSTGRVL